MSRIGLFLAAIILATLFLARAAKRLPSIQPQLLPLVVWRLGILAFFLLWLIPYALREKGGMDATGYHYAGLRISHAIWQGNWSTLQLGVGTKAIRILTGFIYLPFGADFYGFFAVSAAFSLIAMLFQFEAFYMWYRGKHAKLYLALLAFFPSYAMWSSLAGKDSWIALGLGMVSLAYSRILLKVRLSSIALGGAGLFILTIIRPHIALMLVAAIAISSLLATTRDNKRTSLGEKLLRIAGVLLVVVPLIVLLNRITSSFVKQDITSTESVFKVQSRVAQGNSYGGSAVEAHTVSSPMEFAAYLPEGLTRIYLRPFLGEGHNFNMILGGVENAFLAVFLAVVLWRFKSAFRSFSHPFALFSLLMTIELSLLFCVLTNYGLISRQRAQLFPFLFAVAAIVIPKKRQLSRTASSAPYSPLAYHQRQLVPSSSFTRSAAN